MSVNQTISNFLPLIYVLYALEMILSLTSVFFLGRHLYSKYKTGFMSTFMLTLCFFLFNLGLQVSATFMWMISNDVSVHGNFSITVWILWFLTHLGMTASLGFLSFFIISNSFDIYITKIRMEDLTSSNKEE
jgi:hypothetical protein